MSEQPAELETQVQMKSGVINSSLFAAVDNAGVPESVALQIVEFSRRTLIFIGICAKAIALPSYTIPSTAMASLRGPEGCWRLSS